MADVRNVVKRRFRSQVGRLLVSALIVGLMGTVSAQPQPPTQAESESVRLLVIPVFDDSDFRIAGLSREAVAEAIRTHATDAWISQLRARRQGVAQRAVVEEFLRANDHVFPSDRRRRGAVLADIGELLKPDFVLLAAVDTVRQRNASPSEILSRPAAPQSETEVEVRFWVYDVADRRLAMDGSTRTRAVVGGPYFGSTRTGEIRGAPADVALARQNEMRRRAERIGIAIAQAFRQAFPRL